MAKIDPTGRDAKRKFTKRKRKRRGEDYPFPPGMTKNQKMNLYYDLF